MDTTPLQNFVDDNAASNPTLILKLPGQTDQVFTPTPANPAITGLFIHEVTSGKLTPLGSTIDLSAFQPFNIQANCTNTASVLFVFDGKKYPVENIAPFCIGGDNVPLDVQAGSHVISVLAYAGSNATGLAATQTTNFTAMAGDAPNVVRVGPTRAVKDLTNLQEGKEYVLDASPAPYAISNAEVHTTLVIRSNDPKNRATIKFPSCWSSVRPSGPDPKSPQREGTIIVYGSMKLYDVLTVGGEDVIVLGSQKDAVIKVDNVTMDGGGVWRGSGGKDIYIRAESKGRPRGYMAANFTNMVHNLVLDFTGMLPVQQGGVYVKGGKVVDPSTPGCEPQGDAAIRVCDTLKMITTGVKTVPWRTTDGKLWKQDFQCRPESGDFSIEDSESTTIDIGDIKQNYPHPGHVQSVIFTRCKLKNDCHFTPGAKLVRYVDSTVNGVYYKDKIVHT